MVAQQLRARDITDPAVLAAFEDVPRDELVDPDQREHAYDDCPLPIGFGATISQPYVVAMTAQALALGGDERVLDVGTGSGYAAAILARLAREVHTIELVGELAKRAADRLARLGFSNVHVHHGDGTRGWPPAAPYDAIAVAAGAVTIPLPLLEQLVIGGRLVIPRGPQDQQRLVRITRTGATTYNEHDLGYVRFVPLIGA